MDPTELRLRCLEAAVACCTRDGSRESIARAWAWDVTRLAEQFAEYVSDGVVHGRPREEAS